MNLSTLDAGFAAPARDSQAVFRVALQALSQPGQAFDLPARAPAPAGVSAAAANLLLALLDAETRLWTSPCVAASAAPAWLRFHTGCVLVDAPGQAQFAWAGHVSELPLLQAFTPGSASDPDRSATCVLEVDALRAGSADGWRLRGPGIRSETTLAVSGLEGAQAADFLQQWQVNHSRFPCGIDLFLASGQQIAGLPRTVAIERSKKG